MVHQVMDTILYNGAVQSSQIPFHTCGTTIYVPPFLSPNFWANSLIQFGARGGMSLCRHGFRPRRTSLTSIINVSRPLSLVQPSRYVQDRNISLLGDLYSYIPGSYPNWHDFSNIAGKALLELQGGIPPEDPILLRSRQY